MAKSRTPPKLELKSSVQYVKGVGPKRLPLFHRCGIRTLEDLLFYVPRRYEDRSRITPICDLNVDEWAMVRGTIVGVELKGPKYGRKGRIQAYVRDDTEQMVAVWFNATQHLFRNLGRNKRIVMHGKVGFYRNLQMVNPTFAVGDTDEDLKDFQGVMPVYSSTEGLAQGQMRRVIRSAAADYCRLVDEVLPPEVLAKHGWPSAREAIFRVHSPPSAKAAERSRRRLIYEEFFIFQAALALRRRLTRTQAGISFKIGANVDRRIRARFPFKLTNAQERVISEIAKDMRSSKPMSRLLQGDVGCGKTLVAAYAMLAALAERSRGNQVALMAPTEILAEQHYLFFNRILDGARLSIMLHSGQSTQARRREKLKAIRSGGVDLVVGTHALIQEDVEFKRLALVVVDEQHRFGVAQRHSLGQKGVAPDVLLLTATPIPRTLALTLYGEVDVSVIDEMPPGRAEVKTMLQPSAREDTAWQVLRSEIEKGRQGFVVYPLIDESDKLGISGAVQEAERLQEGPLRGLRVCLLHGRMPQEKKDVVMEQFRLGRYDVMVATTVIEVGIDVPNASVMIVQEAQRLGLAQLHQLRGRVGRSEHPSFCILLAQDVGDDARRRLAILTRTRDGFKIAEEDLRIRGPGEFLGTRQSGLPEFLIGNIVEDHETMEEARKDAFELTAKDPRLARPAHRMLRSRVIDRYGERLSLTSLA